MKNILSKIIKYVGIIALVGLLAWGGAYLISPSVKNWTNEHIFQIEQTVEDENKDETPDDETGDETTGDETTGDETGDELLNPDGMRDPYDPVDGESTEE